MQCLRPETHQEHLESNLQQPFLIVDLHLKVGLGAVEPIFGTSVVLPHFLLQEPLQRKHARGGVLAF